MFAYRMGYSPDQEKEPVAASPQYTGARIGPHAAERMHLPCGTRFGDASAEQVQAWFTSLWKEAGIHPRFLTGILSDIDLADPLDRWYALNELVEYGAVRALLEVKSKTDKRQEDYEHTPTLEWLRQFLLPYGLRLTQGTKSAGVTYLYGESYRFKVYLCSLVPFQAGQVTEAQLRARLHKKGCVAQESEVA